MVGIASYDCIIYDGTGVKLNPEKTTIECENKGFQNYQYLINQ